jgi:hypothetical protein
MDLNDPAKIYNFKDDIVVFISVFIWAIIATLIIQLVILRYIAPSLDDGNGLLVGGDWGYFHDRAVIVANQMKMFGWEIWTLKPDKYEAEGVPVGVASAVYYITGINKPWVLAPVHGFFFALSALFLYKTSYLISTSKKISIISILPFVIFPSAAVIYSQLHKDIYTICGVIIIFFLWCRLGSKIKFNLLECVFSILLTLIAFELILIARPYMFPIIFVSCVVGAVVLFLERKRGTLWWTMLLAYFLISFSYFYFTDINRLIATSDVPRIQTEEQKLTIDNGEVNSDNGEDNSDNGEDKIEYVETGALLERQIALSAFQQNLHEEKAAAQVDNINLPKNTTDVIFAELDNIFRKYVERVAVTREGFNLTKNAASTIDGHVSFSDFKDIVYYSPRAVQVGFFAPFPDLWFNSSATPGSQLKRFFVGIEMMISYFLSVGIVLLFIFGKDRIKFNIAFQALIMVAVFITIYALVISNVGALYRFRFGAWSMFNAIGIIGWLLLWRNGRLFPSEQ